MNMIIRLVAAPPGAVSVLDFPMAVAGDGLARPTTGRTKEHG
jgi:hypothetical protein